MQTACTVLITNRNPLQFASDLPIMITIFGLWVIAMTRYISVQQKLFAFHHLIFNLSWFHQCAKIAFFMEFVCNCSIQPTIIYASINNNILSQFISYKINIKLALYCIYSPILLFLLSIDVFVANFNQTGVRYQGVIIWNQILNVKLNLDCSENSFRNA